MNFIKRLMIFHAVRSIVFHIRDNGDMRVVALKKDPSLSSASDTRYSFRSEPCTVPRSSTRRRRRSAIRPPGEHAEHGINVYVRACDGDVYTH